MTESVAVCRQLRLAGPKAAGSSSDSLSRRTSAGPTQKTSGSVPPSAASSFKTWRQRPHGVIGSVPGPVTATATRPPRRPSAMALAAAGQLGAGEDTWLRGKIALAQVYADQVLTGASGLADAAVADAAPLKGLTAEALGA